MARTRRRVKQYRNIKPLNKRTKRIKKQRRRSRRQRQQRTQRSRTQRSRSSKKLRGGGEMVGLSQLVEGKKYYLPVYYRDNEKLEKEPLILKKSEYKGYNVERNPYYDLTFINPKDGSEFSYTTDDTPEEIFEEVPETESSDVVTPAEPLTNVSDSSPHQDLKEVKLIDLKEGKKYYLLETFYKTKVKTPLIYSNREYSERDDTQSWVTFKNLAGEDVLYLDDSNDTPQYAEVPDNDPPQVFRMFFRLKQYMFYTYKKKDEKKPVYVGEFSKFDDKTGTYEFTCKSKNLSINPKKGDLFQMVKFSAQQWRKECASQEDVN
jgi:hypothetical protein